MIVEKIKSKVVSHLSYFIGSQTEAVVVDPQRSCQVYLDIAQREGMTIKYIFETHRNEDYVIGSRELAAFTQSEIYHGPWPDFKYGNVLKDGQEFTVGKLKVTAIQTPGHTPGCMSYTVVDLDTGEDTILVCTGDTLFVNDTGSTDFGGPDKRRELSEQLYNSIFNKLLPLGDHVILCPAHGSGSVCGGGIAAREWSTLGIERRMNPFLQLSQEEFIAHKIHEHHEYAPYFRIMEQYNVEGAPFVGSIPKPKALSPNKFREKIEEGATILDIRSSIAFGGRHIKSSYSLPISRLSMVGWLLPYQAPILLVVNNSYELEYNVQSLIQIGYDNIEGYMTNGLGPWSKAGFTMESTGLMTVSELRNRLQAGEKWTLLDVRSLDEWKKEHIEHTQNIYVGLLQNRLDEVSKALPITVICKHGNRSSIATSLLLRNGFHEVYNLLGGTDAWKRAGYELSRS
ncbi:MAG: MBL fold metallo-hydrolase [Candidatus Bathyarchaeota archaeon]|nr:MAG: MBL fold metallo-hydrolase [Candidatus Bathyarchaeota archaeon]